jgi:hypothetical protein
MIVLEELLELDNSAEVARGFPVWEVKDLLNRVCGELNLSSSTPSA